MRIWPLLLVAACGGGGDSVTPDSSSPPPPDAAATPDAPPGPATLTIVSHGAPASGVLVHFHDPDGKLLGSIPTDANGTAGMLVPAGSSMTIAVPAADPSTRPFKLYTYAGIKNDDHMHLDVNGIESFDTKMTMVVPTDAAHPSASMLYFACGGQQTTLAGAGAWTNIPVYAGGKSACDFYVVSNDDVGTRFDGVFMPQVPIVEGGTITVPDAWQPLVATPFSFTNIPGSANSLEVEARVMNERGEIYASSEDNDNYFQITQGTASGSLHLPPVPNTKTVATISPRAAPHDFQHITSWGPTAGGHTLDVSAALLAHYATDPVFDLATRTVTWTREASGAAPDLTHVEIQVVRDTAAWRWDIVGPGASTATFPQLPAGDFDFNPQAGDNVSLQLVRSAKVAGGYDAVRADFFETDGHVTPGASGVSTYQDWLPPGGL